ncbi:MAG: phosphoribosylformylglycinamidine synthase subunit PurL [Actinobacteria bacterium]|nr:phosphoribosylformylglycinamidine synthase subunit PurL [Actinomycetota bacterium]MCL6104030.1 phosphoribosylformylglycinamidine synthase subunit PurL [Actinomycetota bacterium]
MDYKALGLVDDEFDSIKDILGRLPNNLELAMYGAMWSEHCSYKSSRLHLAKLPTSAPYVVVGPGDNAGIIDVGDGIGVAIRIESHNHPSALEPHQGAATGVGGIIRDIFSAGARPMALCDALAFGEIIKRDDSLDNVLNNKRQNSWLLQGVVSGISWYGNSVGVPTVGGETVFDDCYTSNPLVNVLCLGILPLKRLVRGQATGDGNLVVMLGASTGRDGIGGVSTLASSGFVDDAYTKRPSVQIGDPYEGKRLIEACLEILDKNLIVGLQDLGGGGLTSAASEAATKGGVGIDIDVTAVITREAGMEPFEIMTSESQERMLAIVPPSNFSQVEEICKRWEINLSAVGKVTAPGADASPRFRILRGKETLADIPVRSLTTQAPLLDRPSSPPSDLHFRSQQDPAILPAPTSCGEDLLKLLVGNSWIYRQYDHQLFLNTLRLPGHDSALLRLRSPDILFSKKAVAVSVDSNSLWCSLDPYQGAAMTVAESALNVSCAGAKPLALVDCLNFGNPEHEEVMWQFKEVVNGITQACLDLSLVVVGGNVSFYNETNERDIEPTPVVGTLGLIQSLEQPLCDLKQIKGDSIVLLGELVDHLGGSAWAKVIHNHRTGHLPPLDLRFHADLIRLLTDLISSGIVHYAHDVSAGGLGVALAETAILSGIGCEVGTISSHGQLFSEAPSRVLVYTDQPNKVLSAARLSNFNLGSSSPQAQVIGEVDGEFIKIGNLVNLSLSKATSAFNLSIPNALGETVC